MREAPTLEEQFGVGASTEPTDLEDDVLSVLESLDAARDTARDVLSQVFKRLIEKRLPKELRLEIRQSRVSRGKIGQATTVQVTGYGGVDVDLHCPELTRVKIFASPVLKSGLLGKEEIEFLEPILGFEFISSSVFLNQAKQTDRERLLALLAELERQ